MTRLDFELPENGGLPQTKHCNGCGRDLPIESFWRRKHAPDGRQPRCIECKSKRRAELKAGAPRFKPYGRARSNPNHPLNHPDERFWSNVDRSGDCWLWTGGCSDTGYGSIEWNARVALAHRVSYELSIGPIPDGLFVLHRCDVRACVRPEHLFLGTHLDNMRDCKAKGRHRNGARRGWILTVAQIREIRARAERGETNREIAKAFSVHQTTVRRVVHRHSWGHVA